MNADVTKGVDGIKMKLDEAIFFGQGNGSPSRVCFECCALDETIWNHCDCFWEDGCNRCLTYVSFPGLKSALVSHLWVYYGFPLIRCLYERFAWRQQDFISDPNAASLHHRPSLPRSAEDTWYDETIWNHCVCFWEDGCNRCLTYVSFPGLKSALVSHLWVYYGFPYPLLVWNVLLEGSRISFQTLMQHHFITDHHCRGYVIW